MTIRVIEQTTAEREQEIKDIYQQCKPYLDEGIGLTTALRKAGYKYSNQSWCKELFKYAESQGYVRK